MYDYTRLMNLGVSYPDAMQLRRIAMTLQRWFELECGDGNDHGSWAIARGKKTKGEFEHDDDGAPYMEHHHYLHGRGQDYVTYTRIADRENGAKRRLAKILARYPTLTAYIQTDPRGAALYILEKKDTEGKDVSCVYSSFGVAIYK